MCNKNSLPLWIIFLIIMFSVVAALTPISDIHSDGEFDSLITEGLLLLPLIYSIIERSARQERIVSTRLSVRNNNGEQALQMVHQILDQLVEKGSKPIIGIGVGTPGLVNTGEGVVVSAVNLDWRNLPLARLLASCYSLPVSVLNDSQAIAIGEFVYNPNHESGNNLIVVNVRRGIGAGIIIDGRIFHGDGGGAGEIGHVVVQKKDDLCRCGKCGGLETIASTRAIIKHGQTMAHESASPAIAMDSEDISLESIKAAFLADDPWVRSIVIEAGQYLGSSIASLIGTLNIKTIVLTGELMCFGAPWLQLVRQSMRQAALTDMTQDTQLEIGKLGPSACILGTSASMLLNSDSPLFIQTNVTQG